MAAFADAVAFLTAFKVDTPATVTLEFKFFVFTLLRTLDTPCEGAGAGTGVQLWSVGNRWAGQNCLWHF